MTGPGLRRLRLGHGPALLFLVLWAVGLAQSTQVIRASTYREDIYAEIGQYRALREILDDALLAGFRTDSANPNVLSARRWPIQYAAMPTIVQRIFTDEGAFTMAIRRAHQDGSFHLVYEYRRRPAFVAFDQGLRQQAASAGCDVTQFGVTQRVVVYRLHRCTDG